MEKGSKEEIKELEKRVKSMEDSEKKAKLLKEIEQKGKKIVTK